MSRAGDLIFEARRRAGLSQAELARRAGVSRPTVNAYERGRREPGAEALQRLLAAAGSRLSLVPAFEYPDPEQAARDLVDLLSLADAIPTRGGRRPLLFPSLARR
ncbi:MAG TPA: helix-turn-helix transcriptional regulator [Acidimicrobiia bacterium]|jgi:transcriptional regulator with XRE-family HTH domain|nr:helix-turn-helix transcriptional regulator [Acidimicrobiia bacterium]